LHGGQDFNGRIGPKGKTWAPLWAPFLGPNQCWMGFFLLIITKSVSLFEFFLGPHRLSVSKKGVK